MDIKAARSLALALTQRAELPLKPALGAIRICRQTGALDEARLLAQRLACMSGASPSAQALDSALHGRWAGSDKAPSPFFRRCGFLDAALRQQIFYDLTEALPNFCDAEVTQDPAATGAYMTAERAARVLFNLGPIRERFLPILQAFLVNTVYPAFGVNPDAVEGIEMQASCYGDGAFFSAHTDCDLEHTNRRSISFVYYLHSRPRAFTGGDLILFDARHGQDTYDLTAYSRVLPEDNSLIVFPSDTIHEVQEVSLPDTPISYGRLTLNGWVHTARLISQPD